MSDPFSHDDRQATNESGFTNFGTFSLNPSTRETEEACGSLLLSHSIVEPLLPSAYYADDEADQTDWQLESLRDLDDVSGHGYGLGGGTFLYDSAFETLGHRSGCCEGSSSGSPFSRRGLGSMDVAGQGGTTRFSTSGYYEHGDSTLDFIPQADFEPADLAATVGRTTLDGGQREVLESDQEARADNTASVSQPSHTPNDKEEEDGDTDSRDSESGLESNDPVRMIERFKNARRHYYLHGLPEETNPCNHLGKWLKKGSEYRPAITHSKELGGRCTEDAFKMGKKIGSGGFGEVYRAKHRKTGKDVALKIIMRDLKEDQYSYFRHEECLQHRFTDFPFVVQHYCTFIHHTGKVVFVLEYVRDAVELFELINEAGEERSSSSNKYRQEYTVHDMKRWGAELVATLKYLHGMSVAFRDLKPENVLVTPDGHIMLVDFGLAGDPARSVEGNGDCVQGTPNYIPPEYIDSRAEAMTHFATFEADWYALGIILYELAFHYSPFPNLDRISELRPYILAGFRCDEGPRWHHLCSVVESLCHFSPSLRIGARAGSDRSLGQCSWFQEVGLSAMLADIQEVLDLKDSIKHKA